MNVPLNFAYHSLVSLGPRDCETEIFGVSRAMGRGVWVTWLYRKRVIPACTLYQPRALSQLHLNSHISWFPIHSTSRYFLQNSQKNQKKSPRIVELHNSSTLTISITTQKRSKNREYHERDIRQLNSLIDIYKKPYLKSPTTYPLRYISKTQELTLLDSRTSDISLSAWEIFKKQEL
jgi:hypothetical protein